MVKKVIKEIFIMILLLIAIVLLFGVLFYEYIPSNKTIPEKVTYKIPGEVQNEIQDVKPEEATTVNVVYQIDAAELNQYQRSRSYDPGKLNPFAAISSGTTADTNTTGGTTSSGTSSGSGSTGQFLNTAGSK